MMHDSAELSPNLILILLVIGLSLFWLALVWRGRLSLAIHGVIAMFVVAVLLVPVDQTFLLMAALTIVTIATLAGRTSSSSPTLLVLGKIRSQHRPLAGQCVG